MSGAGAIVDRAVEARLRSVERGVGIASMQRLSGGAVNDVWLVRYRDGSALVVKTLGAAPDDLFRAEAAGLDALRATRTVRVPEVVMVTESLLLLEQLPPRTDSQAAWEALAEDLAALHQRTVHNRFGWHHDGYLGQLRQSNPWIEDGHAFFAEHRLLRYLAEPGVDAAIDSADRGALQRLCDRLPEIIPPMPAVLTHGDLWANNLVGAAKDRLAVIDPAVAYGWAESDLAMLYCCAPPPAAARFFTRYQELHPSPDGWLERMPLLFLREVLSQIAHGHDGRSAVERLRRTLTPFYPLPIARP